MSKREIDYYLTDIIESHIENDIMEEIEDMVRIWTVLEFSGE